MGQGREAARTFLKENEEKRQEVAAAILEHYGLNKSEEPSERKEG
jgi:hypothetical protein